VTVVGSEAGWVVRMDERPDPNRIGGKASGLFRLLELGLPVPRFAVLTVDAFRVCCADGLPSDEPAALTATLDSIWSDLGRGSVPLAVRSSAIDEDSAERSWAGQMRTHLNVVDRAGLGRAVTDCWASLFSERATAYRALSGAGRDGAAMAVVVQEMVNPAASGVLFTLDPVSGNREKVMVSAVLGLGEGLVSGALDADTYLLDADGSILESTIVQKEEQLVLAQDGGVSTVAVAVKRGAEAALSADVLRSLCRHSRRAAEAAGVALDIEFAVQGGKVFYLQARPVTAVGAPELTRENRLVWDNSNIVESYPGITLPLTFSFIRRAYHAVYWQFCELLGLGEDEIRANDHMLRNMLGLHRGQVYYNLRNWYRLVSILPGFRHNRRFMEGMMGVSEEGGDPDVDTVSRARGVFALVPTGLRALRLQLTLDRRVRRFHRTFERVHAEFAALPYEEMAPHAVMSEYRRVERALLWRWKAPILNDFSVMIFYGLLKRLTVAWNLDPEGNLQNALVAGQGGIESAEVSDKLEELARGIAGDEALRAALLAASPREAIALVRDHPEHGPGFARYMERFGDRCVAELKLESQTMHDDPTPLIAALQGALRRGGSERAGEAEGSRNEKAMLGKLGPARRLAYRWVLRRATRGIRNRENQRLARTRAFALVRRMMRAVGARLAESGIIESSDDVFYLELEEIMRLCDGTSTLRDPKPLVSARKREYDAFRSEPLLPDRFVTYGPASVAEPVQEAGAEALSVDGALSGLGAYPGVVEREAAVLTEPDPGAGLDGHVLVTRQTDPGWVIVFPAIGGLVVERGSMLSHSAIVAREMRIPAVVGVKGATQVIRTGDTVRLDGAAGTVVVIEAAPRDPA
jgi:phosphoenolpyruvate synthase/pyruvate phosphate dikinase